MRTLRLRTFPNSIYCWIAVPEGQKYAYIISIYTYVYVYIKREIHIYVFIIQVWTHIFDTIYSSMVFMCTDIKS